MGLPIRNVARGMSPRLVAYRARVQVWREAKARIGGTSWGAPVAPRLAEQGRIAVAGMREAEAWQRRIIQERCDAYLAGWYD